MGDLCVGGWRCCVRCKRKTFLFRASLIVGISRSSCRTQPFITWNKASGEARLQPEREKDGRGGTGEASGGDGERERRTRQRSGTLGAWTSGSSSSSVRCEAKLVQQVDRRMGRVGDGQASVPASISGNLQARLGTYVILLPSGSSTENWQNPQGLGSHTSPP